MGRRTIHEAAADWNRHAKSADPCGGHAKRRLAQPLDLVPDPSSLLEFEIPGVAIHLCLQPLDRLRALLGSQGGTAAPSTAAIVASLDEASEGRRRAAIRASILAYAFFLEQEGRLTEALDMVGIVGRTWPGEIPPVDFGGLALHAARLNRLLARWDDANDAYRMAENAGAASGDRVILLRG